MKKSATILLLMVLSLSLFSQTKTGTLKIFSEANGTVTYLDEVKQDDNVKIINNIPVGSHYLKVMLNGTAIYSELVEIKLEQVTTVLIKGVSNKIGEKPVEKPVENTGVVTYNPNPSNIEPTINGTDRSVPSVEPESVPFVNIGQENGKLSLDVDGAFGLTWGMKKVDTYKLLIGNVGNKWQSHGKGFSTYLMDGNTEKPFFLETRFIDDKLFEIIIGYVAIDLVQQKVDKLSVPVSDYNEINKILLSTYGQPTTIQRDFTGGYKDGDGREVEAIKKHQATLVTTWVRPNGNDVTLRIMYTKAMVVAVMFENGAMFKEAHDRKLKINSYQY
jgi:hypothetical protein